MGSSPSPEIYIPEQWLEAVESIAYSSMPPIILIYGAKNCGKTTFSRYLLSVQLLKYPKVAYLGTDVGQPEFTPPAFLSLTIVNKITPDFTVPCLKTPERDPSTYLSYVFGMYDYYKKEYCISDEGEYPNKIELPLMVNTPGWVKGVGYVLLVDMLKYISPTHAVKINIYSENKNVPAGVFWLDGQCDETVDLLEMNSARQDLLNRSVFVQKDARLLRDLRIMAYFKQFFSSDSNISTIKELARAWASHCPYEVPIASIKIRHIHCEVQSSEIFYSLNASIVGLAVDADEPENLPWCLGLGIVRGIDTVKDVLYIITPVLRSSLEKVNLFLQGYIQIPFRLLQVQGMHLTLHVSEYFDYKLVICVGKEERYSKQINRVVVTVEASFPMDKA